MKLNQKLAEQVKSFDTFCLATADSTGRVDCATVYFAFDDEGYFYFGTSKESTKALNLAKNARVAAAIDDEKQVGVQLRGRAELLEGASAEKAKQLLLARHSHIDKFMKNPTVRYYRLVPEEKYLINFAWGVDWRIRVD